MTGIPSIIASRYHVIREIGRGGMGAVYLVKHQNTGAYHALKVLHEGGLGNEESIARFKREMRLPAKIRSEHVVTITDADAAPELGGAPFLVMELLYGCDLSKLLEQLGARSGGEVLWIIGQVAKALDKAHALGIVHRDLKPENLFLHRREDETLMVKILDFGIAKLTQDIRRTHAPSSGHAHSTSVAGTPLYMAPEQAQGQTPGAPPIGPPADLWALAMMTFELLTGQTYWQAENPMQLMGKVFFANIEAPSQRAARLPRSFDAWFLKSCDRDPGKRWKSASEQLQALAAALGARGIPADTPQSLVSAVLKITPPPIAGVGGQDGSMLASEAVFVELSRGSKVATPPNDGGALPWGQRPLGDTTQPTRSSQMPTMMSSVDGLAGGALPLGQGRRHWFAALRSMSLKKTVLSIVALSIVSLVLALAITSHSHVDGARADRKNEAFSAAGADLALPSLDMASPVPKERDTEKTTSGGLGNKGSAKKPESVSSAPGKKPERRTKRPNLPLPNADAP